MTMKSTLDLGNEGVAVGALLMKALNPLAHRSRGYDTASGLRTPSR